MQVCVHEHLYFKNSSRKIKQTVYEYLILDDWDNSIDKAKRTLGTNVS